MGGSSVSSYPDFPTLGAQGTPLLPLGVTYLRAGVFLIKSSAEDSPPSFLVPHVLPPTPTPHWRKPPVT